jgi:hypothetical protein
MPEPSAHDRRASIDKSADPDSVWYIDSDGGKRDGHQVLVNKAVVRHGQVFVNAV